VGKPKNRGLGRGLGALLPAAAGISSGKETSPAKGTNTGAPVNGRAVEELPVEKIRPNPGQPRHTFDEAAMEELAASIRQYGVLQPILVRPAADGYEIVAGERRYRAAKQAGLEKVPAIVRRFDPAEMAEVAIIENVQREDLNVIEEAQAYQALMDRFGLTQAELSQKVGASRSHIANILRLLTLPERVQESLLQGVLVMGQARPVLALPTPELMQKAADHIAEHGLSAREAERLVARLKKEPDFLDPVEWLKEPIVTVKEKEFFVEDAEEKMKLFFGAPVKIHLGMTQSRIVISFKDQADLDRIVEALGEIHTGNVERKKTLLREVSRRFTT